MSIDDVMKMRQYGIGLDRNGNYWSDQERTQVKEEYYSGIDISHIALIHQRSELAIVKQLDNIGAFRTQGGRRTRKEKPRCICYRCDFKHECIVTPDKCGNVQRLLREVANV